MREGSNAYEFNAQLLDSEGAEVSWAGISFYGMSGVYRTQLEFSGPEIRSHGLDGPYTLDNLHLYTYDTSIYDTASGACATHAYSVTGFAYDDDGGSEYRASRVVSSFSSSGTYYARVVVFLGLLGKRCDVRYLYLGTLALSRESIGLPIGPGDPAKAEFFLRGSDSPKRGTAEHARRCTAWAQKAGHRVATAAAPVGGEDASKDASYCQHQAKQDQRDAHHRADDRYAGEHAQDHQHYSHRHHNQAPG